MLVAVADRGRGIPPAELPHIFDPFYRGRFALDRQIHGNGLGLSLVKRIAEAHGGRVSVKSAPDQGSTFIAPPARGGRRGGCPVGVCASGGRADFVMPAPASPTGQTAPARRVLLVEDEPGLVLTLTDRLKSEGYVVASATDGPSGLALATREAFDVILLDVMLPGSSGFDVCRDLRQKGVQTPVIMLTARGQVMDKVLGLKIGADDYLTKPFDMLELLARIEVQIRRASASAGKGTPEYRFGEITVNFRKAEVTRAGEQLELSAREFLLLKYFIEHREATLTRDELLNEVWGYHSMPSTRTVDVHVAWLRQKIEPNPRHPQYVLTVHGMGVQVHRIERQGTKGPRVQGPRNLSGPEPTDQLVGPGSDRFRDPWSLGPLVPCHRPCATNARFSRSSRSFSRRRSRAECRWPTRCPARRPSAARRPLPIGSAVPLRG